jgi:hypothetical protein
MGNYFKFWLAKELVPLAILFGIFALIFAGVVCIVLYEKCMAVYCRFTKWLRPSHGESK